jgi:hypothetical protein
MSKEHKRRVRVRILSLFFFYARSCVICRIPGKRRLKFLWAWRTAF